VVPYGMIETRKMLQPRRDFELRHLQGCYFILSELARGEMDLPGHIYLETTRTAVGRERVRSRSVPDIFNCVEMHRCPGHAGARLDILGQTMSVTRGNSLADETSPHLINAVEHLRTFHPSRAEIVPLTSVYIFI
jgi:hypothetical protein